MKFSAGTKKPAAAGGPGGLDSGHEVRQSRLFLSLFLLNLSIVPKKYY